MTISTPTPTPQRTVPNRPSLARRWYIRSETHLLGVAGLLLFVAVWQGAAEFDFIKSEFLSSPSGVVSAGWRYLLTPGFRADVGISVQEFGIGYALSAVVGIPLGLAMGFYRRVNALLDPLLNFFNSLPHVALMPVLIIWFGLGSAPIEALVFSLSVFTLIISVISGVRAADSGLARVARSFGASDLKVFRTIILPAAVPSIIAGLRLALGRALIGVIVGELISSNVGIGHMIMVSGSLFEIDQVFAGIVFIAVVGVILSALLRLVEAKLDSWRPELT